MFTPISVCLSGPAFSFLLYENSKCRFQQEGFLLGEIVHKETTVITDNDQKQINISKTVKINSVMPCPEPHFFYNGSGKVNKEKVVEFLGNQFKNVVAWYKYHGVPSTKFTLRDKIIHRQLMDFFKIPPELFTCCLLSTEVAENSATHTFSQIFVRCNNIGYEKLPINIPNLSEPNNSYKNSEPPSKTFNKILKDLKIDKKSTQGLVVINKIQSALQKHIDSVVKTLSESEVRIYELEQEVKQLQTIKKLQDKNELDSQKALDNSTQSSDCGTPIIANNNSFNAIDTTPESSPEVGRKSINKAGNVQGKGKRRSEPVREPKESRRSLKTEGKEYAEVCKN